MIVKPPTTSPRRNPKKRSRLVAEHRRRKGDPALGGSTRAPIMTAYRQQALACASALSHGPRRVRDLRPEIPDAPKILLHNVYGWFDRAERGIYVLTDAGHAALKRWPQAANRFCRRPRFNSVTPTTTLVGEDGMIMVTGSVTAREKSLNEVLQLSLEHVQRSREEPGCISHAVHIDCENPLRLVFVEQWADRAALLAHFAVPASRNFVRALQPLAATATTLEIYDAARLEKLISAWLYCHMQFHIAMQHGGL